MGWLIFVVGCSSLSARADVCFFKQKTAYEVLACLEFSRVLFRSVRPGVRGRLPAVLVDGRRRGRAPAASARARPDDDVRLAGPARAAAGVQDRKSVV